MHRIGVVPGCILRTRHDEYLLVRMVKVPHTPDYIIGTPPNDHGIDPFQKASVAEILTLELLRIQKGEIIPFASNEAVFRHGDVQRDLAHGTNI